MWSAVQEAQLMEKVLRPGLDKLEIIVQSGNVLVPKHLRMSAPHIVTNTAQNILNRTIFRFV